MIDRGRAMKISIIKNNPFAKGFELKIKNIRIRIGIISFKAHINLSFFEKVFQIKNYRIIARNFFQIRFLWFALAFVIT